MTEILHLDIEKSSNGKARFSYFKNNPFDDGDSSKFSSQILIDELLKDINNDYYLGLEKERLINPERLGKKLYRWLDGDSDSLSNRIDGESNLILAISAIRELSYLPWELLHDGEKFLVQRNIIPIRWVKRSSDSTQQIRLDESPPQKRALKLLFMATDPVDLDKSVFPLLEYEKEEAKILGLYHSSLFLKVEDSGCLEIMENMLVEERDEPFDVFHLTGHAFIEDNQSYFFTESEIGTKKKSSADDIAKPLRYGAPRLIFLSGCYSGQAVNAGALPSLAESLVLNPSNPTKAVLGWGHKTLDTQATEAATIFYKELNRGQSVIQSLAFTYQELIENEIDGWHLLRLYVSNELPHELVTSSRSRRRPKLPPATKLWGKRTVATGSSFVGRRRPIQYCLRELYTLEESVGVVIHGFGGYGKSSLAAKLCDRLSNRNYIPLLWNFLEETLNEKNFINQFKDKITKKYPSSDLSDILDNQQVKLSTKLYYLFEQLNTIAPDKNFLFIFDDFEQVLRLANQNVEFKKENREAKAVLISLIQAIKETDSLHRIIITSRYDLPTFGDENEGQYLYRQPLSKFEKEDLEKKLNQLDIFKSDSKVSSGLRERAITIANGNARILERLDEILGEKGLNHEQILQKLEDLENNETEAYEDLQYQVITKELLKQVESDLELVLSRGLIFEIPVPREALEEVCQDISHFKTHIDQAIRLGLISESFDKALLYVVRTFLPISPPDKFDLKKKLAKQGAEKLYDLWWNQGTECTEKQAEEILRLSLEAKIKDIAIEVGDKLTKKLNENRQFENTVDMCEKILKHWQTIKTVSILHNLAIAYSRIGEVEKADKIFKKALNKPVIRNLEIQKERADLLVSRAGFLGEQYNKYSREVLRLLEESFSLAKKIDDYPRMAVAMFNLGRFIKFNTSTNNYQSKLKEAEDYLKEALKIYKKTEVNNTKGQAICFHELGMIQSSYGYHSIDSDISDDHYREAISLTKKSKEICQKIGDLPKIGYNLVQLGKNYVGLGKYEIARKCFKEGKEIIEKYDGMSSPPLHQWAKLEEKQGNFLKAIELDLQSLAINQKFHRQDQESNWILIERLFKAWKAKDFYLTEADCEKSARELMQQLLELSNNEQYQYGYGEAIALWGLGAIAMRESNTDKALQYLNRSYTILSEINPKDAFEVQNNINKIKK